MSETLTIELKDAVAAGPLPPPPAPPAYTPPAPPAQAQRLPAAQPGPSQSAPAKQQAPAPAPRDPEADARRLLVEEEYRTQVKAAVERLRPPVPPPAPRDPMEEAKRLLGEETYRAEVRANLEKLRPPEPPPAPPDPLEAAKKILATEEYHRAVREQLEKLRPPEPPPPPRDPVAEAGKLFAEEEHRKAVRAELEKLRPYQPPTVRDPAEDARRLFAEEEHRKQVQEELKKLQPLSDWEKNTRPELRVNPQDNPQLADAKRRQQHSEYEQEVDRLRKLMAPPKVLEALRPEPWEKGLPPGLRPQKDDSDEVKAGKRSAAQELYNRRAEQERLRQWAQHVPGAALEQRGQQVGQLAGLLPGGAGQAAGAAGRGLAAAGQLQAAMAPGGAAAAGGLAGAAALAGPIGLMAAAAMELQHQVQEMGRRTVQGIGQTLTRTAALDEKVLGDAVERGTELGMKALSMVPGVGVAAGLMGPAAVEAVKQVRAFGQALDATASRLAPYHGKLSEAEALADVRSMLGDYRRAQKLGDGFARWVEARSKIDNEVRDLLADGLKPLLELIASGATSAAADLRTLRVQLHRAFPAWFSDPGAAAAEEKGAFDEFIRARDRGWWGRLGDAFRARPEPPPIAGRAGGPRLPLGGP